MKIELGSYWSKSWRNVNQFSLIGIGFFWNSLIIEFFNFYIEITFKEMKNVYKH